MPSYQIHFRPERVCVHREREVSFKEHPGALEREAYTRVLKGLIALSTAVFPEKVARAVTGQPRRVE